MMREGLEHAKSAVLCRGRADDCGCCMHGDRWRATGSCIPLADRVLGVHLRRRTIPLLPRLDARPVARRHADGCMVRRSPRRRSRRRDLGLPPRHPRLVDPHPRRHGHRRQRRSPPDVESGPLPTERRPPPALLQGWPRPREVVGHDDHQPRPRRHLVPTAQASQRDPRPHQKQTHPPPRRHAPLPLQRRVRRLEVTPRVHPRPRPHLDARPGPQRRPRPPPDPAHLQLLSRTDAGAIYQSWSTDSGKTWAPTTPTTLPNPNSGIDGVQLQDGRSLLVYNPSPKVRHPIAISTSLDGTHWEAPITLEDTDGPELSYPAVIQTADGLVHITYTWARKKIRHVTVDPARLP
jgi:hypothetical protein